MADELPGHYPDTVTATSGGLTTGLIGQFAMYVAVTSASASNFATLPYVPGYIGQVIQGYVGANGFKLTTAVGSAQTINTVTTAGAVAGAAIPANSRWTATNTNGTNWIVQSVTNAGAAGSTIVPA